MNWLLLKVLFVVCCRCLVLVAGNAGRICRRWFVSDVTAGDHCDADGDAGSLEPRQLYTDTATSPAVPSRQAAASVSCLDIISHTVVI